MRGTVSVSCGNVLLSHLEICVYSVQEGRVRRNTLLFNCKHYSNGNYKVAADVYKSLQLLTYGL